MTGISIKIQILQHKSENKVSYVKLKQKHLKVKMVHPASTTNKTKNNKTTKNYNNKTNTQKNHS